MGISADLNCPFTIKIGPAQSGQPLKDYSEPYNSYVELARILYDAMIPHSDLIDRVLNGRQSASIVIELRSDHETT